MKKTFVSIALLLASISSSFAFMPNEKILKSFKETFHSPQQVKWFEHKTYCEVSFMQDKIRSLVKYDLLGNFLSSTRYYTEQQLPTNLLYKLKKRYASKKIFGVTELTNSEEIVYYIKLEDDKHWMTVKVGGSGQMEVVEKYRKA